MERIVPLKGNKFYGLYYPERNEYRACVEMGDADDAPDDLEKGKIPGGLYVYAVLKGSYREIVRKIKPTFDQMRAAYRADPARPCVEFYRRHAEIVVMLPVIR